MPLREAQQVTIALVFRDRRAVGHDVRGLELEVRVPLREAQQVTIALVFRDRLLPFARLRLRLSQLRA